MAIPSVFANKLERRLTKLETARGFFVRERAAHYLSLIQGVTSVFLIDQPIPSGLSEEQWKSAAIRFTTGIRAHVLKQGFSFRFEGVPLVDEQGNPQGSDRVDLISYDDILAWIRSGEEGEPLGKRIMPGEDLTEAAHLVYTAVHGKLRSDGSRSAPSTAGPHVRLREALREYLGRSPYSFGRFIPALRQVWKNTLRPYYLADMKRYVRRTVRGKR